VALLGVEALLAGLARLPPDQMPRAVQAVVMPAAWERRPAVVPGTLEAYYWHGILHTVDRRLLRRAGEPFPPKRSGVTRILALGDSLTYGAGVAMEAAWPAQLERRLGPSVEVLNLGISGAQSADIALVLDYYVSRLDPDRVIYGVCINDFLPAGRGQRLVRPYDLGGLPGMERVATRTHIGRLIARAYDGTLMALGVRPDIAGDILEEFPAREARFGRDVRTMVETLRAAGLPPLIAMVVHQVPGTRTRDYVIVQAAERQLHAAGATVVPARYLADHAGESPWFVSAWEQHPSVQAHAIYADELAAALRR
jgi:lysophospholipase L1-like esterase